jgi:hypothetical protein
LPPHFLGMAFDFHRLKLDYHRERLRGCTGNPAAIAAEMRRYRATANIDDWFNAWDREVAERALEMQREVGLAPGPMPSDDFLAAARRAIVFELGGTLASVRDLAHA